MLWIFLLGPLAPCILPLRPSPPMQCCAKIIHITMTTKKIAILSIFICGMTAPALRAQQKPENLFDRLYSDPRAVELNGAAALPAVPEPQDESGIFAGFDGLMSGWRNVISDRAVSPGAGAVLARIEPSAELDNYLRTNIVFKTPKGHAWHIAATRVVNCPDGSQDCMDFRKYFILFMRDDGRLIGASGFQISNYSFLKKGEKTVFFDGDKQGYTVKLYVNGLSVEGAKKSVLEISLNGRVLFKTPIGAVIDAMNIRGVPVRLSRNYRVFLGRDIRQDKNGEVFRTDETTLALVPENAQTDSETISLTVSDITPEGVIFPADKNFALRRTSAGVIELYKL